MRPWNVVVTVHPGGLQVSALIGELRQRGDFRGTSFRDVLVGHVGDISALLDSLAAAQAVGAPWVGDLGRVIPVERVFDFTPGNLAQLWIEALPGFLDRMRDGSFYVRLERRGLIGQIHTVAVERVVADRLLDLAEVRGLRLRVSFADPDYILLAETFNAECGLALIARETRQRYPFVHTK
ncbi:MAG TPA: THUMP domain-containing protein [Rhodocyclaceae bacterium]|nr:THUMP domain-containing protein [Rhodocyclaceae bacterium]